MFQTVIVRRDGRVEVSDRKDAIAAAQLFEMARTNESVLSVQMMRLEAGRANDERWSLARFYMAQ